MSELREIQRKLVDLGVPLEKAIRAVMLSQHVKIIALRTVNDKVRGATILVPSQRIVFRGERASKIAARMALNSYLKPVSIAPVIVVGSRGLPVWEAIHKVEIGFYGGYCTCPDAVFRQNRACIHILAAAVKLEVEGILRIEDMMWLIEEIKKTYGEYVESGESEAGG